MAEKWHMNDGLTESQLGWGAGIIDGEGCISIYGRAGRTHRGLQLVVSVVNTDLRMPLRMRELFGGTFTKTCEARPRRRPTWTWLVTGRSAAKVLGVLYPHLTIKREQTEVAMAYAATIGRNGPLSDAIRHERQRLREQLALVREAKHGG